jgi:hypothetical protein
MLYQLRDGVTVENFGEEFVLYDGAKGAVHRVSAVGAPWLVELMSGNAVEVDEISVSEMLNAGLLVTHEGQDWSGSRRRVLALAGSVTAAVGLTTLFLPSAAAAASIYLVPPPQQYLIGYGEQDDRYSLIVSQLFFVYPAPTPSEPRNQVRIEFFDQSVVPQPILFNYTVQLQGGSPLTGYITDGDVTVTVPNWDTPGEKVFVTVAYSNPLGPDSVTLVLTWP